MRDLIIALLVFGAIPWILLRPHIGVLVYAWLGLMNPHRLTWGFAYTFPFSTVVAVTTLLAMVFSRERLRLPWNFGVFLWLLFVFWMNITTYFALVPIDAIPEWDRAMKIQLMVFASMLMLHGKKRIVAFVWVIVFSLGFYGVKGGIFSILSGGQYLVMGPWDSFIADNNTLALALIMTLPLMRFLMVESSSKLVQKGLLIAMILTAVSIVNSHSRGALIAGAVVLLFLILKGRHRARFLIAASIVVPVILFSMPEIWWERMATIADYQNDPSAMGRINAWGFAVQLAADRPFIGGGFNVFTEELFIRYAPSPLDFHDAHSIYFEVLAEHGFVGLGLFLAVGYFALRSCTRIMKMAGDHEELQWAKELAAMLQVGLIGYASAGAFLGLAYYDLYYNILAIVMLLLHHVRGYVSANVEDNVEDAPNPELHPAQAPIGAPGVLTRT